MSLDKDAEEFYEKVTDTGRSIPDNDENWEVCKEELKEALSEGKEEKEGIFTQYSSNGPGFSPATATFNKLKAGVYTIDYINHRVTFIPRPIKTDNLLRLPDSKSELVITQIEKFWTKKEVFSQYGFLHKRGFMLYGPPGSGKTATLSIVMADMVKRGGIVVVVQENGGFVAEALASMRLIEPERPIVVVMEDIDELIRRNNEAQFLALMDGELQIDNVVYIATTNYPDRLDKRLTNRPSRFDLIVKIDMPNKESRRMYLEEKLKDKEQIEAWVTYTEGMSFAHIKELIVSVMCLGNDLSAEVTRLKTMMSKQPTSDEYYGPRKMGLT